MFDSEFAAADDAAVVAAIEECARLEAIASARRLAAIAELARRMVDDDEDAAFDGWAGCAAQVGAALSIGQRRASAQMRIAIALRDRLPKVAALALKGELSARVVATITWRTSFVVDDEPVARIDAAIAERATGWGRLSDRKLDTAIDGWVARYDPEALRTLHAAVRARHFTVGHRDDATGTTSVWGRLSDIDAETLDRRVTAMVGGVCADDPRSIDERRSAAVGAIGAGEERLACACGSAACPSAAARPASNVVIHVLAEQCAVDAARTPSATREQAAAAQPPAALIVGGKVMPAAQLGAVIRGGATVRPIQVPGAQPEPRYRPSAALAQFVRLRDLFCRAPGCDVPAERCDIDHTIPYPLGPTHASNLKLLCRTDHLMKTFGGWHDVQLPDGTVIWTSPTGRRYVTKPGAALFFPHWDTTTADLPPPPDTPPPTPLRELKMPRRRRTRAAAHAAYINAQRALNRRPASF
jgi:hypothetical protein